MIVPIPIGMDLIVRAMAVRIAAVIVIGAILLLNPDLAMVVLVAVGVDSLSVRLDPIAIVCTANLVAVMVVAMIGMAVIPSDVAVMVMLGRFIGTARLLGGKERTGTDPSGGRSEQTKANGVFHREGCFPCLDPLSHQRSRATGHYPPIPAASSRARSPGARRLPRPPGAVTGSRAPPSPAESH